MKPETLKLIGVVIAALVGVGLLSYPAKGLPERVAHIETDVAVLQATMIDIKEDLRWIRTRMERNGRQERIEERDGRVGQ